MKIAFLVDRFPNLSETFILNQITGLLDQGCQVDIFASGPTDQPTRHTDIEKYGLLARTYYHGAGAKIMPTAKFSRLIKALALLTRRLPRYPLPLLKSLNPFKYGTRAASLGLFYKTVIFLDQAADEYDIVHCHFGPNGNLAALLKEVGVVKGKVVTTFHGYDLSTYVRKDGGRVYQRLFQNGDLFLPISERWREVLLQWGCPAEKIVVHRMGIDPNRFAFSARQGPDQGDPVRLLTIARLVEKKGVKYAIEAVARVMATHPRLEYNIAGDGPLKEDLQKLIDRLNLGDRVKLLGWQRQEEVVRLMAEADLLLAPSVTSSDGDQEGIPVVLMEALAQGVPVLSTWHSGIPELVRDGESGFLVAEGDGEALAEKLAYFVQHPEIWPEFGRRGREWVEKYYNIHKLNAQLVSLYGQLLTGENVSPQAVPSLSSQI